MKEKLFGGKGAAFYPASLRAEAAVVGLAEVTGRRGLTLGVRWRLTVRNQGPHQGICESQMEWTGGLDCVLLWRQTECSGLFWEASPMSS